MTSNPFGVESQQLLPGNGDHMPCKAFSQLHCNLANARIILLFLNKSLPLSSVSCILRPWHLPFSRTFYWILCYWILCLVQVLSKRAFYGLLCVTATVCIISSSVLL